MKKLNYISFLVMILTAAFFTFGNAPVAAEKVLTIAVDEEIEGTDTHQIYWYSPAHEIISEPLIRLDLETKNIVPALARKFEISNDGKDLIFTTPNGHSTAMLPKFSLSIAACRICLLIYKGWLT
jgi:ABC-type transport system substrate-binding protein